MADVKALEYSTMKVGLYLVYLRIGVVEFKRELGHTSHRKMSVVLAVHDVTGQQQQQPLFAFIIFKINVFFQYHLN